MFLWVPTWSYCTLYGPWSACAKPALCLALVLEGEQRCVFHYATWIFAFESIITKPSPQTTAKTSHASYTHFFPLQTGTQAPTKSPAHSRVSLKFFSNTAVEWLSSTKCSWHFKHRITLPFQITGCLPCIRPCIRLSQHMVLSGSPAYTRGKTSLSPLMRKCYKLENEKANSVRCLPSLWSLEMVKRKSKNRKGQMCIALSWKQNFMKNSELGRAVILPTFGLWSWEEQVLGPSEII